MANKVTIDVEARFVDNVTDESRAASKAIDGIGKEARDAQKELDRLSKKKARPIFDADNNKFLNKVRKMEDKLRKLGHTKTAAVLDVVDKATVKVGKVMNKLQAIGRKTWQAALEFKDHEALATIRNVNKKAESFAKKTWTAVVKVKDLALSPVKAIRRALSDIPTLITAVISAKIVQSTVMQPVTLADSIEQSKIAFESKLGSAAAAESFLQEIYKFDEKSPFDTTQIVGITQQMMNLGWTAEDVLTDLGTIGDWSASLGKGTDGISAVTRALGQMRMKGKLSSEEMLQLTEAGVNAWQYVADYMGKDIATIREMAEDGAISVDTAIKAIMTGMGEYTGAAATQADRTVKGLIDQVESLFKTYITLPWGEGLGEGFKDALADVRDLIDENKDSLKQFGEIAKEVGQKASRWIADRVGNALERIEEITGSFEFKNASLGEKFSMLWKGVIADPLKEWFNNLWTDEENIKKATEFGETFAKNLTKGILAVLGITDIFEETGDGAENSGSNIAQGFAKGFVDGFDVSAITDKLVEAISNVWNALPWWGKMLVGGYVGGKTLSGVGNVIGGISSIAGGAKTLWGAGRSLIGSTGNAMVSGSGMLGGLANIGYWASGGAANAAGYFGNAAAGLSGGMAALGGAGGIAGAVSTVHGLTDLYRAYKSHKQGSTVDRNAYLASGGTTLGGVAAGAAIGSFFGPVGALLGAGIGGIAGWIGGDKWADNIRAAKFESEEMKAAINDSEKSAEELAETFEKAKWENAKKHFGDIKLSMSEIERIADQIVWGDDMGKYEKFTSSVQAAETALQSFKTASDQTERWMWKASLGVKFNEDERESIKQSFDEYINSAKTFVENKHYEFTAAVSLLVDVESKEGKAIIDSGNAFYGKMQKQLEDLGGKLSEKVDIALKDGVITLNEQKEIASLQQQIASITEKLASAEEKAELELIKLKFGNGNLDYESFENFMSQMQTTIDERMAANDEAFVASVSSLNLQLAEGAISKEEYDKQLETVINGYTGKVENLQAEIKNVELKIIGEAYADELGKDAAADLEKALQHAIDNGIDPIDIPDEKLAELLNVEELSGETAGNIKDMLSGVLDHIELLEVDGNIMLKIGEVETEGDVGEKVDEKVPDKVEKTIGVDLTGEENILNTIDVAVEEFGIPEEKAAIITMLLSGDKEIINQIDTSIIASEFGIPESKAEQIIMQLSPVKSIEKRIEIIAKEFGVNESEAATILWNITGEKNILNTLSITRGEVGIKPSYTFGTTINLIASKGSITKPAWAKALDGESARGNIWYPRGMNAKGFADGGIVRGGARLIKVAEEGSPEMIIPLSSQRRERGLKLWRKAGSMMGVPGFARGGLTTGGQDEGIRHRAYGSSDDAPGGQTVQVEVGGITVEINVNAGGTENIAEAIKAQANEIAETVAGVLADAFTAQFENTPARGGGVA